MQIHSLGLEECEEEYFLIGIHTTLEDFKLALNEYEKTQGPFLIEFLVSAGSRAELGRPKESPKQNLAAFMNDLKNN